MIVNILLNHRSDCYVMEKKAGERRIMLLLWAVHYGSETKDCSAGGLSWTESADQAAGCFRCIPDLGWGPVKVWNWHVADRNGPTSEFVEKFLNNDNHN